MNLFHKFKTSVEKHRDRPALVIDEKVYTYQELYDKAMRMGGLLVKQKEGRVGLFASKTVTAYVGLLGAMASGKTYVPLLDEYPIDRNRNLIKQAEIDILILDRGGLEQIIEMENVLSASIVLIAPDIAEDDIPKSLKNKFVVFTKTDLQEPLKQVVEVNPDRVLCIAFTSGSTGESKMVPSTHSNWIKCFNDSKDIFQFTPSDRVAHSLDLTFSFAHEEFFKPWSAGARVYVLTNKELRYQVHFVQKNRINFWLMSPSNAQSLIRFGLISENSFPDLKITLFGGEPLSKSFISEWQKAAPNSKIRNGIGSTETQTIAYYQLPKQIDNILAHNGIVSVGTVLESLDFCLLNDANEKVADQGELCVTGPGVFSGYLNKPKRNAEIFIKFEDDPRRWFKTGDMVKQEDGHLFHLGRKDFMVKIRGARVDLEEVNFVVKEFTKAKTVYTIPYPVVDGIANYLYVFMSKEEMTDKSLVFKHLKEKLPFFMLPKAIFCMDDFPKSAHGKLDRNQLIDRIKEFQNS